jgi:hypothetical protein
VNETPTVTQSAHHDHVRESHGLPSRTLAEYTGYPQGARERMRMMTPPPTHTPHTHSLRLVHAINAVPCHNGVTIDWYLRIAPHKILDAMRA